MLSNVFFLLNSVLRLMLFLYLFFRFAGKNWDFTAALSDFEQLRQVHAGNLAYSLSEERSYLHPEKDMARVGRPMLHRQDEVVQGKPTGKWTGPSYGEKNGDLRTAA